MNQIGDYRRSKRKQKSEKTEREDKSLGRKQIATESQFSLYFLQNDSKFSAKKSIPISDSISIIEKSFSND